MKGQSAHALLADIGGTNARFALAGPGASGPLLVDSIRSFPVAGHPSLEDLARHYLELVGIAVSSAVVAVAGPVEGDQVRMTNHPWVISRQELGAALGLESLTLVNDFGAQAMAVPWLQAQDLVAIGPLSWSAPGTASQNYAVLGPGTGLGVAALIVRDGRHYPIATEGGHAGFAPRTPEETAILGYLSARYGRVSNERLVSGEGLVNLYRAQGAVAGESTAQGALQPADITARAAQGDARSVHAVELFCAIFGAIAGDFALTFGAWDGVFLSGGMVPRLLKALQGPGFRQRFEDKGRYAAAMAGVPTLAVLHPYPGLLGAAAIAAVDRAWKPALSGPAS